MADIQDAVSLSDSKNISSGSSPTNFVANSIALEQIDGVQLYRLGTINSLYIHQWLSHVYATVKAWDDSQPCNIAYDYRSISLMRLKASLSHTMTFDPDPVTLGVTTEMNEQILDLLRSRPSLKVKLALIVQPSLSARVSKIISPTPFKYRSKFFGAVDPAIAWLRDVGLPPSRLTRNDE